MIRVGAAMFALLVAANVAVAQGGGGNRGGGRGPQTGQMQADRLMTDITLTDAQKAKIADVGKWMDTESAKLPPRVQGDTAGTGARTKLTADFRSKLKDVLTDDQKKTFDDNVAKMGAGRGRRGGGL
jgi:Spy/CpxP family protein refolding chaperone